MEILSWDRTRSRLVSIYNRLVIVHNIGSQINKWVNIPLKRLEVRIFWFDCACIILANGMGAQDWAIQARIHFCIRHDYCYLDHHFSFLYKQKHQSSKTYWKIIKWSTKHWINNQTWPFQRDGISTNQLWQLLEYYRFFILYVWRNRRCYANHECNKGQARVPDYSGNNPWIFDNYLHLFFRIVLLYIWKKSK